jgi:hypothetical protein
MFEVSKNFIFLSQLFGYILLFAPLNRLIQHMYNRNWQFFLC